MPEPQARREIAQVNGVLEEIGAGEIPHILLYNKIDGCRARRASTAMRLTRHRVWISARNALGLELLARAVPSGWPLLRGARACGYPGPRALRFGL